MLCLPRSNFLVSTSVANYSPRGVHVTSSWIINTVATYTAWKLDTQRHRDFTKSTYNKAGSNTPWFLVFDLALASLSAMGLTRRNITIP
jgi:hypothetical protein